MLRSLKLRDFKRHKNIEVNFTPGLNLIIGGNYKGKSSLLHGIRFLLGGYSAVPGGKAVAVNDEASNAAGELTWTMGGAEYRVERKGSNATLYRDDEPIAKGAKPVAAELRDLFGMDDNRFGQLKYSAQKQTESLLTLGTTKLHQIIEEISGATLVNRVADLCKSAESECSGGLAVLPEVDAEALAKDAQAKAQNLQSQHAQLTQFQAELEAATTALEDHKSGLQELKEFNQQQTDLQARHDLLSQQLAQWRQAEQAARERMPDTAGSRPVEELDAALARARAELADCERALSRQMTAARDLAALRQTIDKLLEELDSIEPAHAEAVEVLEGKDLEKAKTALSSTSDELAGVKRELAMAEQAAHSATCPTCHRAMEGADPAELQAKADNLKEEARGLAARQQALASVVDAIDCAEKELARLTRERGTAQRALSEAEEKVASLEAEMEALQIGPTRKDVLTQTVAGLQAERDAVAALLARAEAAAAEAARAAAQAQALEGQLAHLEEPQPLKDTTQHEEAIEEASVEMERRKRLTTAAEEAYRRDYAAWQALSAEAERAKGTAAQRASLAARLANAVQLRKFLLKNRDRYLAGVWDGIMAQASSFTAACTDGYIERIERSESGDFTYVEAGVSRPIEAGSGAQRSIMGLGVMLALSALLPCPLDTLLLDEPTADADAQHSLAMATLLAGDGRQLIMVSHRELDNAVAQNVIEVA